MWEDVLSIVDNEIGEDESRLFVQDTDWDGTQYIRLIIVIILDYMIHQFLAESHHDNDRLHSTSDYCSVAYLNLSDRNCLLAQFIHSIPCGF